MTPVVIEQLWIYPVKSLAGIPLESATLSTAGLVGDREWMIVDGSGRFLTQRQIPKLATIRTAWVEGKLTLSHPATGTMPVVPPAGTTVAVKIWKDDCRAVAAAAEANRWLRATLCTDEALTLVHFAKEVPRPTNPQRFGPYHTYFSDGAPYLVANLASLDALNARLTEEGKAPVDIRRFRPNLVVSGLPAFAEHALAALSRPDAAARFGLKDHCQRCSVITVDQNTGLPSPDTHPFKTLAQVNSMPANPKAPAFGVNSVLETGAGTAVRCGEQWLVEEIRGPAA